MDVPQKTQGGKGGKKIDYPSQIMRKMVGGYARLSAIAKNQEEGQKESFTCQVVV